MRCFQFSLDSSFYHLFYIYPILLKYHCFKLDLFSCNFLPFYDFNFNAAYLWNCLFYSYHLFFYLLIFLCLSLCYQFHHHLEYIVLINLLFSLSRFFYSNFVNIFLFLQISFQCFPSPFPNTNILDHLSYFLTILVLVFHVSYGSISRWPIVSSESLYHSSSLHDQVILCLKLLWWLVLCADWYRSLWGRNILPYLRKSNAHPDFEDVNKEKRVCWRM